MKVILQNDVRDLGKVGDLVNVATGYARNFLFPRQLAAPATTKRMKEMEHYQKIAESKKAKVHAEKEELAKALNGVTVDFKRSAGEEDKLFGSVTTSEIAEVLKVKGFVIDKRDLSVEEAIKVLGQHKAVYKIGEGLQAEIKVNVEREG